MKTKKPADNFYKSLSHSPEEIIEWCKYEIEQYQLLIKIIKRRMNK